MAMGFEWVVMATAAAGSGGSEVGWSCADVREEMGCGWCTGGDGMWPVHGRRWDVVGWSSHQIIFFCFHF
uniref:Uncharacterized protein n=1 Tax=Oryza nivara TaxID=4536 RepID=A0A0E0J3F2_ORYNI